MSAPMKLTKSIAVGAILAASVGCASTSSGPNAQLSLASDAPSAVKSAYSQWVGGRALGGDKERCFGVSLKGENDCGAGYGSSCKGAKSDCKAGAGSSCKGAKHDCKAGAGSSCKGKAASHDCKAGAGSSCKGAKGDCKAGAGSSCKGAKSDCKAGAGSSCKGKAAAHDCKAGAGITCKGNATVDWQGDAWQYVPKGSCEYIVTPGGRGSLTPK